MLLRVVSIVCNAAGRNGEQQWRLGTRHSCLWSLLCHPVISVWSNTKKALTQFQLVLIKKKKTPFGALIYPTVLSDIKFDKFHVI